MPLVLVLVPRHSAAHRRSRQTFRPRAFLALRRWALARKRVLRQTAERRVSRDVYSWLASPHVQAKVGDGPSQRTVLDNYYPIPR
jgi:hypothetical protein